MIPEQNSTEYLYSCPLQNEKDLQPSAEFCKDMQCVFVVKTTNTYNEQIRCQKEIIPFIIQKDNNKTETTVSINTVLTVSIQCCFYCFMKIRNRQLTNLTFMKQSLANQSKN